jgi:hypothetical protein
VLEPGQECGRGEHVDPGGSQFDRQGQAIQPPADGGDIGRVGIGQGEPRFGGAGPGHEKAAHLGGRHLLDRRPPGLAGHGQGGDRIGLLAGEVEHDPAGDQQLEPGRGLEQGRQIRRRLDHLLEVVQHQEQVLIGQRTPERLDQGRVDLLLDPAGLGDRGEDEGGIADGRERDEDDAIGKAGGEVVGHGQRQPGLADPTGAGQGQDRHIRIEQQVADSRHFPVPADQGRARHRERGGTDSAIRDNHGRHSKS